MKMAKSKFKIDAISLSRPLIPAPPGHEYARCTVALYRKVLFGWEHIGSFATFCEAHNHMYAIQNLPKYL